jgi:AcrR family transcriptional regulator
MLRTNAKATSEADRSAEGNLTEARLLREAARLFRRQGYARTSTRELATAVGLQSASLYHYMKTKEDLLSAICLQGYELMIGAVTSATEKVDSPTDALKAAVGAHLKTAIDSRDIYLTTLSEARSLSPRARRTVDQKGHIYTELLTKLIERAQEAGGVRTDISADHLMLVLRNQLSWTIFWFNPENELSIAELSELMSKVFLEGAQA